MKPALLVLGATGGVGRGVVRAALDAGRPVIAVATGPKQGAMNALRELQQAHPHADLATLAATVADERRAAALAQAVRRLDRPLDGVVAALCTDRERGRLLDQPANELRGTLDAAVVAHLAAARHLLPLLAANGRSGGYILIDGPGGEHPWAGYGHRSVGAAALRMLARVLHDEARSLGVRLQMLSLDWPVRTDANARHACAQWPSATCIGQRALALIDRRDPAAPDAIVPCAGPTPVSAQCLADARSLLESLDAPFSPSPTKEDAHDRSTRR
jgi:NAD(P)-dependent dehydrogenase (short-subunit alcohol dehydrogenase family)